MVHDSEFIKGFSPTISYLPVYPNPTLLVNALWCISVTSTFRTGTYSDKLNEFEGYFKFHSGRCI
jgi:hypothetical protein